MSLFPGNCWVAPTAVTGRLCTVCHTAHLCSRCLGGQARHWAEFCDSGRGTCVGKDTEGASTHRCPRARLPHQCSGCRFTLQRDRFHQCPSLPPADPARPSFGGSSVPPCKRRSTSDHRCSHPGCSVRAHHIRGNAPARPVLRPTSLCPPGVCFTLAAVVSGLTPASQAATVSFLQSHLSRSPGRTLVCAGHLLNLGSWLAGGVLSDTSGRALEKREHAPPCLTFTLLPLAV